MKVKLLYPGTNSMVEFQLEKGEAIKAESDAMVGMSRTIDLESRLEGGIMGMVGRFFSGENLFFQTLRASRGSGSVLISPSTPGDVVIMDLDGSVDYIVQKDGYLASEEQVSVSTTAQNLLQGFLSGEGFFVLRVGGVGKVVLSSFGSIHEVSLAPGEEYIVDNYHLVAWPSTVSYSIEKASSGWISSFTSGEGFVCRFRGPGKIYIQSRNASAFGAWLRKLVPVPSDSGGSSSNLSNIIDIGDIFK